MNTLHPTQLGILNQLLFGKKLRFTDLKIDPEVENNTFQFHLNKVISLGYVQKSSDGYSLTEQGKVIANYIDIPQNEITLNRKSSVHLYCLRDNNGTRELLIKRRFKHPFYGQQGLPTGKILKGERFSDAAIRVVKTELNLEGEPKLIRVVHYFVKDKETNRLLDDMILFDYYVNSPTGILKFRSTSHFEWVPVKDLAKYLVDPIDKIEDYQSALHLIENFEGKIEFLEGEIVTDKF